MVLTIMIVKHESRSARRIAISEQLHRGWIPGKLSETPDEMAVSGSCLMLEKR
jgi:hypothetical protein